MTERIIDPPWQGIAGDRVLNRVADHLHARVPGHPLRVAIDGAADADKNTFAHSLAVAIEARGRSVIRLSADSHDPQTFAQTADAAPENAVLIVTGREPLTAPWDDIVFLTTDRAPAHPDEDTPADRATIVIDIGAHPVLRRVGGTHTATAQLFSYGTLQLPQVQVAHFGRELAGIPDTLPGHRTDWVTITDPAVIADSGTDQHPIVRPTANPADTVPGTVFTITTTELAAADTYEVDDYRRVPVHLASGATAWSYLAITP
ncbi:gamma-glutamylcyclotransferase [Actinokineospora inagensis]|uniref:gamma-glutamylcyclotransferase n=1 Tax=Actinokineospora inagensis TaxID=103730 RepID=UPI0003FC71BB|nr:gamma-glutamylcyclotransferase [Actinokineospora inagensis]